MSEWFAKFSRRVSTISGHHVTFVVALGLVIFWAASGPFFQFAEAWQLVINTGTTIITFLMVFVLQSTQNRDSEAMHIKLDEIISSLDQASNRVLAAEEETQDELDRQRERFEAMATKD